MPDIYFWRQCFVVSANFLHGVSVGTMLAFPAVLNPAITSPNSTDIRTTGNHASWIASINGIGGLFGSFGVSPIMQLLGRKAAHYSINVFLLIGWIMFPFSKSIAALYAARFIQGFANAGVYTGGIIVSEYVHPSRRGYFVTLMKVMIALGALCCHAMGAFWTWRQISMVAVIPPLGAIIVTAFWPESPSYFALKGRFSECETSFKWLNGNSEESQKHLKLLIEAQREKIARKTRRKNNALELMKTFLEKDFQKAFFVTALLTLALDVCGRYYLQAYLVQIMMDLLGNKASATYFTLGSDMVAIIASSLSIVVIRNVKRRTILFLAGSVTAFLMFLISVLVYLKTTYSLPKYFLWFTAMIIILQSFVVNIGLSSVAFTIIGEIFPLEHKGMGSCMSGVIFASFYAIIMKITPVLIEITGLYGIYAIYGVFLAIILILLFVTLPETKDKTLQDIEDELNNVPRREIILLEGETRVKCNEMDSK